jgi:polar amino acid transport system substrate-binding protein
MARRLGVPFEPVEFQRIAEVIEAMKAGDVDFTISNATPARAADVAFSQTLLSVELGYLVSAISKVATIADIDKSGVRVGVTEGSTSQRTLPNLLPNATVVPAQNSSRAVQMLDHREIDVFATNKPTLFGMSDRMPGARVLDGQWGVEHIAIAVPRGREAAMEYLRGFVADMQTNGLLSQAVACAGLRGVVTAQ